MTPKGEHRSALPPCPCMHRSAPANRDSGSKLCRLGYAKSMKPAKTFSGIVLSAEGGKIISAEDADLIRSNGIAGINCSWNRIDEVPTGTLGKPRNQRRLPLLFAANTVNYGKPWKMNTAEALAAGLYIAGFKEDAIALMYPFSYGQEFLRLNSVTLEGYSACSSEAEVARLSDQCLAAIDQRRADKEQKAAARRTDSNIGGYMDDMDLPPMDDDYEEEDQEEEAS